MRLALVSILVLAVGSAEAQQPPARSELLKSLGKPSKPMMMPLGQNGGGGPIHPMPSSGFSLTDGVNTPITFLIVPNQDSKATIANRHTLQTGTSANYGCGQLTCYVRFMARGAVQAVQVARGHAYRFQFVGDRFDLYAVN